ncbi:hypothetical protein IW492_10875 [Enterococcus sp. BWB1-3]|uniref:hypothetical protein n=1 Tax=unclassified Enterococcus TaxID=2608891 RepID=UPI001922358E|nr:MULTISPECIES: hypothetical protein [unclassified Enterococcus]MBL1229734.1 hypothetical protein [Enterococcus sp. BWB1-3]MCB5952873.1 hypothetical protein [Enterococcus sp. BWT-B8]
MQQANVPAQIRLTVPRIVSQLLIESKKRQRKIPLPLRSSSLLFLLLARANSRSTTILMNINKYRLCSPAFGSRPPKIVSSFGEAGSSEGSVESDSSGITELSVVIPLPTFPLISTEALLALVEPGKSKRKNHENDKEYSVRPVLFHCDLSLRIAAIMLNYLPIVVPSACTEANFNVNV